jgi:hypothetical protein
MMMCSSFFFENFFFFIWFFLILHFIQSPLCKNNAYNINIYFPFFQHKNNILKKYDWCVHTDIRNWFSINLNIVVRLLDKWLEILSWNLTYRNFASSYSSTYFNFKVIGIE